MTLKLLMVICSGSQSLCKPLDIHDPKCIHVLLGSQILMGHSELPGNELVDQSVREVAGDTEGDAKLVSCSAAYAAVKAAVFDPEPDHGRTRQLYTMRCRASDQRIVSRDDQILQLTLLGA